MKFFTAIVILSFIAIGVFGFAAMGHGTGCLARAIQGVDCPANSLASAIYHAQAFLALSLAILAGFVLAILVLAPLQHDVIFPLLHLFRFSQSHTPFAISHSLLRWLSLHEVSPPRG